MSNYLRAQKSGFNLLSAFVSEFFFLSVFLSTQKPTQGTSEPLWHFEKAPISIKRRSIQSYQNSDLHTKVQCAWKHSRVKYDQEMSGYPQFGYFDLNCLLLDLCDFIFLYPSSQVSQITNSAFLKFCNFQILQFSKSVILKFSNFLIPRFWVATTN